jgi:phage baseplate assembly protein gpV
VSELSTAAAMLRPRESSAAMALGIVTSVDDPENKARIKVSLPAYQDVETDWMGVVSVGAGEGKGLIALPDVGDRVLVLLAFDDPGQGIVLGGLFGMDGAADSGIEAGRVKRFTLQTPGGQRIQLDDVKNLIRLEDHSGSFVELSPSNVTLHAAVDLNIEAPGKHIVIRGNLIDFEQG